MEVDESREPAQIATWSDLPDREPIHARVEGVDLVVIRYDDEVSVLYGRCLHRGVLLGDGYVEGQNLICGHDSLSGFERRDLTTWKRDVAELTGVEYAGVGRES